MASCILHRRICLFGTQPTSSLFLRLSSVSHRSLCAGSASTAGAADSDEYRNIINNKQKPKGPSEKLNFQAETRQLLDIVAKSLYSDRHVFVRELVSNASDALEKLRQLRLSTGDQKQEPLEIHIQTDETANTIAVQDTGIGLTKQEAIDNLGTIAKSGSQEFAKQMTDEHAKQLIGQFGVGFYSAFMVADRIDVYSLSCKQAESQPIRWSSDGKGEFEVSEAENVDMHGTKIVLHLKSDAKEFAREERIREIVKKYSGFTAAPIFVNGKRVNPVEPLWLRDPSRVTEDEHKEFYKLLTGAYDSPRFTISYKTDAPVNLRALLYVPETKPAIWELSRESETGVALYSRRVLVLSKAHALLPRWLRFLKGVVDSEDVPLNLSRELLQDNRLIQRLNQVVTSRVIRYFGERAKKQPEQYAEFYRDFGLFFKEAIVTTQEQAEKEKVADLLRFESSALEPGQTTSLSEYKTRQPDCTSILFISAPSRQLAESSPYLEAVRDKKLEVLFLYEPYDELVLMQLGQFGGKRLQSVENELARVEDKPDEQLSIDREINDLAAFMTTALTGRVKLVKPTGKLSSHPCVVSIKELGAVRHLLRTALHDKSPEERLALMEPVLEINAKHSLIQKLASMTKTDPELAKLFAYQLCDNALTIAGVLDDPRTMIDRLNDLLTKTAEKLP